MRRLELYLIRHAPSIHARGIVPPADPAADISATASFKALASALPEAAPWWVSPLQRCRMTATALEEAGAVAGPVHYHDGLVEQSLGAWHGQPISDVWAELEDGPKSNWHFLHPDLTPPGGESVTAVHARTRKIIDEIETATCEALVIIGHSMVNRSLIAHALGLPAEKAVAMACANLSLTHLTCIQDGASTDQGHGGNWMLNCLNRKS